MSGIIMAISYLPALHSRGVDKFVRVGVWDVVSAYRQIFAHSPLKIHCTAIYY